MPLHFRGAALALSVFLASMPSAGRAQQPASSEKPLRADRVVAGGEKDFLEGRPLVLTRSNEALCRALAELARERHQASPSVSRDPLRCRVQRRYIEKNDPILYERMRGVAAAFGKRLEDDTWNFSGLGYVPLGAGCSVVHFPP